MLHFKQKHANQEFQAKSENSVINKYSGNYYCNGLKQDAYTTTAFGDGCLPGPVKHHEGNKENLSTEGTMTSKVTC